MKIIKVNDWSEIPDNFTGIAEYPNGDRGWYKEGKCHREDGPAVEHSNGDKFWYVNGLQHREDGPAVEYKTGENYWYKEGILHRENGPAVECSDELKKWFKKGKCHREDGPAIEWSNGDKEWWIDSTEYSWFRLFALINHALFIRKEKDKHNLEWLRFLTEKGIEEFPIIPGMELDKNFKNSFEKLGINR